MADDLRRILSDAVQRLLRPLVRVMLRNGMTYGEFADLAKWVFVDVADREFPLPDRKQSVSRISVITGLNRKEVTRLRQIENPDDGLHSRQYNRAARVITGWISDPAFRGGDGRPARLPLDGEPRSFGTLVRAHSGDMTLRAVLDELVRVGAVAEHDDGSVSLLVDAYIPRTGEGDKLHILGTDVALLLETIDHNLRQPATARFQRKVAYDNLPREALPALREMGATRAQQLLVELNDYLARHDRDLHPETDGSGRYQAGLGIYYFENELEEDSGHE